MSFSNFCQIISSTALKAVAVHWNEARAERRMPSWGDIRPSRISAHLPIVWAFKYDSQTREFTGRLAGQQIEHILSICIRGLPLSDVFSDNAFPWAQKLFSRVVLEPAMCRSSGHVFQQYNRLGIGERIILPLSADGTICDGILGASQYVYTTAASECAAQSEDWFFLSPIDPEARNSN